LVFFFKKFGVSPPFFFCNALQSASASYAAFQSPRFFFPQLDLPTLCFSPFFRPFFLYLRGFLDNQKWTHRSPMLRRFMNVPPPPHCLSPSIDFFSASLTNSLSSPFLLLFFLFFPLFFRHHFFLNFPPLRRKSPVFPHLGCPMIYPLFCVMKRLVRLRPAQSFRWKFPSLKLSGLGTLFPGFFCFSCPIGIKVNGPSQTRRSLLSPSFRLQKNLRFCVDK